MSRDYGREAHEAAQKHLDAINAAEYAEDSEELPDYPEDMAGPWDGCETCVIREVLHAAWPILLEAAKEQ